MFKYFAETSFLPSHFNSRKALYLFSCGWCLVLLMPFFGFAPYVQTFIHPWRTELAASLLFLITLIYLIYRHRSKISLLYLSSREINFIVLPLLAFIFWSGLSMFWAVSVQSALYHTLIWIEYLIFYIIARQIINNGNGYKAFITALTATLLIVGLPSVLEYSSFLVFGGATSLGMRYAKYGELLNTVFPLITIGVLRLNGKRFIFGLLILLAMWLFIISTLGRTNLILFVCGIAVIGGLIFALRSFHKYRRKMAIVVFAAIFVLLPFHLIALLAEKPSVPTVARMSGGADINYSFNFRKLMTSISIEMFTAHPIVGVGADNFGIQVDKYRVIYAAKNSTDIGLSAAENEIAERGHNEFLQILAELGIFGFLIFLWFLSGVGLMFFNALKRFRRVSLFPLAALLGIFSFLASSLVSSFSFRLAQNGLVFFFVLAVAAKFLFASKSVENHDEVILPAVSMNFGYAFGIAACVLLAAHCLMRAASVYYSNLAQAQPGVAQAMPYYQTAFWLDGENPDAHYALGRNLIRAERYGEAVPQIEESIRIGRATSTDYSYLATAQTLSGDAAGAEKTFAEAVRLYPLSPFARARYAGLLQANGHAAESAEQLQISLRINKNQTNTWWTLMNEGARQATLNAAQNKDYVAVMDLTPGESIYAIVADREIKYPNEKINFNFGN